MKIRKSSLITALLIIATVLYAVLMMPDKEVSVYEVLDKCEEEGRCYIETWIEVTPEEYIGLDIGDEYEGQIFE